MRHRRLAACLLGIVLGAVACGRVSAIHAAASPLAHAARSPGKSLSGFQMFGERQGWGLGHGLIARTSDGARTFKDVTPANVGSISQDPSAFFLDADRAWVTSGNDTLDRTADGGATWTAIHMSPAIEGSVTFYDEQHGWLVQGQDTDQHTASLQTLWRTVDGGSTWTPVYRRTVRRSIEPHVQTGDCVWAATAWITSQHGLADVSCPFDSPPALEATDDGGSTWHLMPLPALPNRAGISLGTATSVLSFPKGKLLAFVSRCVGEDGTSCSPYGALYRSSDGGRTWIEGVVVDAGALAGSLAPDPEHAWLPYSVLEGRPHSGGPAPLLTTADGGVTWTQLALPAGLSPNLHAHRTFQLATPEVGYAVAEPAEGFGARSEPPTFFRTDDGGRTFTQFLPLLV